MKRRLTVILAGGEGRRIGGGKPLRILAGETLVERAIRTARGWSDDVRVAVRESGQVTGSDLPVLVDLPGLEGPLAGIGAALHAAREIGADEVLALPCDTPFLPADLGERLHQGMKGRAVAIGASGGELHPASALWRTEALDALAAYSATGRRSLIGFADQVGFATVEWPPPTFFNINDPEALAEAERLLASEIEGFDSRAGRERRSPRA